MPIVYNKMLARFEEKGITSYKIKKDKIIGQATWKKIHEGGHIDTRTLGAICELLECQPGDLLEYVKDDEGRQFENE
ncbi:MAG: helix-turn-helix domain-containing protein [Anaerotignum sp.]|jgi:DNA-binding Xre family transcriptional regulator|nr:helix-turn-helix domain-containing protein [Anaerotignum sp.]